MNSPQTRQGRILTYGQDRTLLETRCMLLEEAGYTAETVLSLQTLQDKIDSTPPSAYDLLVICHTVPATEQASINTGLFGQNLIYQIETSVEPTVFLQNVARLLETNGKKRTN